MPIYESKQIVIPFHSLHDNFETYVGELFKELPTEKYALPDVYIYFSTAISTGDRIFLRIRLSSHHPEKTDIDFALHILNLSVLKKTYTAKQVPSHTYTIKSTHYHVVLPHFQKALNLYSLPVDAEGKTTKVESSNIVQQDQVVSSKINQLRLELIDDQASDENELSQINESQFQILSTLTSLPCPELYETTRATLFGRSTATLVHTFNHIITSQRIDKLQTNNSLDEVAGTLFSALKTLATSTNELAIQHHTKHGILSAQLTINALHDQYMSQQTSHNIGTQMLLKLFEYDRITQAICSTLHIARFQAINHVLSTSQHAVIALCKDFLAKRPLHYSEEKKPTAPLPILQSDFMDCENNLHIANEIKPFSPFMQLASELASKYENITLTLYRDFKKQVPQPPYERLNSEFTNSYKKSLLNTIGIAKSQLTAYFTDMKSSLEHFLFTQQTEKKHPLPDLSPYDSANALTSKSDVQKTATKELLKMNDTLKKDIIQWQIQSLHDEFAVRVTYLLQAIEACKEIILDAE